MPFPPPGDRPDPGLDSTFLSSPALAGGFFTNNKAYQCHLRSLIISLRGKLKTGLGGCKERREREGQLLSGPAQQRTCYSDTYVAVGLVPSRGLRLGLEGQRLFSVGSALRQEISAFTGSKGCWELKGHPSKSLQEDKVSSLESRAEVTGNETGHTLIGKGSMRRQSPQLARRCQV